MAYDFSRMGPNAKMFSGLGQSIPTAIGAGIQKQRNRRLFDALQQQFIDSKRHQASMNALATLGLKTEPIEGGEGYEKYSQFMDQLMAAPQARGDIGRSVMDIDPDAGMQYMLGEAKVGSGASGKKESDPQYQAQVMEITDAIADSYQAAYIAGNAVVQDPKNPELQGKYYAALSEYMRAKGRFVAITGKTPSYAASESQISTNLKLPVDVKNQAEQILKRQFDTLATSSKALGDINQKLVGAVSKFKDKFDLINQYLSGVAYYKDNFEALQNDPDALAGITKHLGQIIEPGLQVTEGEVSMFQGNNAVVRAMQLGAQSLDALAAIFNENKKALAEAGTDNPGVYWKVLTQADNLAARSLNYFKDAITKVKPGYVAKAENEANLLVSGNDLISEDKKQLLMNKAKNIGSELDYIINAEIGVPIKPGTPMPGSETIEKDTDEDTNPLPGAKDLVNQTIQETAKNAADPNSIDWDGWGDEP